MLIDQTTFELLKSTINKDGWLELPAYGNSMFPFIQEGNICRFIPFDPHLIKKGDVILFISKTGQLIAHRYIVDQIKNNKRVYLFKGDTNLGIDVMIEQSQILGKLELIKKQHFTYTPNNFISVLWGKLILAIPVLSGILRKYLNWKLKLQY
jgi:signal peptidase I